MTKDGCSYGNVTRQIVVDIKESIDASFKKIDTSLTNIKEDNKQLYNHMSSRLPMWASILFTILGSLVVGLIVYSVV